MTSRLCIASLLTMLALANAPSAIAQRGTRKAPVVIPPPPLPVIPRIRAVPLTLPPVPIAPRARVLVTPIAAAKLVEQLRTADSGERRDIIRQLSDTQQKIVPTLVRALNDPDPLVKSGVAEALGNLTDASIPAIPGLIAMTSDPRRAIVPVSRFSGVPFLYPIPLRSPYETRREPPTPPQNPGDLLRVTAIVAIGKIGLPARTVATPSLTQSLQDPDPWVRLSAAWALAEIGASVPILSYWLEALQSPDRELRRNAADVFQDYRSLLRKALGAEADDRTPAPLITALKDDDATVRGAAGQALELIGTGALPGLVQALKAPEPVVRLESARLVGNLGAAAQTAVPDLLALLEDSGQYVPPIANRYGGFPLPLRPYQVSNRYNYRIPDNPEQLVRVNASIALGALGDRRAIPALTTALKDDNPWMQLATGWALFRLGETQGLTVVGRLLQHPSPSIQQEALSQLEEYGVQSAPYLLPYYTARLESTDDYQRNGAIIRIGGLGVAALELVPRLRTFLVSNQKNSPGYAATILGNIAQSTAIASRNGSLSTNQRRQAIGEFAKVLDVMQAPKARFNRQPIDRVRNALATLKGIAP